MELQPLGARGPQKSQEPRTLTDCSAPRIRCGDHRSEEHTSELQSLRHLVCRLLLEKNKTASHLSTDRDLRTAVTCPPVMRDRGRAWQGVAPGARITRNVSNRVP